MSRPGRGLPLSAWLALALVLAIAVPAAGAGTVWWGVQTHQRAGVRHRVQQAVAVIGRDDRGAGKPSPATLRALARLRVEASFEPAKPQAIAKIADPFVTPAAAKLLKQRLIETAVPVSPPVTTAGLAATLAGPDGKRALQDRYETIQVDDDAGHSTLFVPRPSVAVRTTAAVGAALALLVLVLAVVLVLLRRWVVRPLALLSGDADAIAGGTIAVRPVTSRAREVTQVGDALHGMAGGLRDALAERAVAEDQRRFLVTAIAHDLRTPLFTLRGSLEAIEHGIGEGDHLRRAQDKAKLLDGLVSELFAFSRLEYAGPDVECGTLDAAAVAREAAAAVDEAIVVSAPSGGLSVTGDHRALLRVLINLLDNAVRHARSRVDLVVRRDPDGSVVFEVDDDGSGVDDADLPHLFEPLFRADRTRSRTTGGAGLGLAIAERLAGAQGATVHVENLPAGGARFTVRHPGPGTTNAPPVRTGRSQVSSLKESGGDA